MFTEGWLPWCVKLVIGKNINCFMGIYSRWYWTWPSRGSYGDYVADTGSTSCTSCSFSRKSHYVDLIRDRITWRCNHDKQVEYTSPFHAATSVRQHFSVDEEGSCFNEPLWIGSCRKLDLVASRVWNFRPVVKLILNRVLHDCPVLESFLGRSMSW